MLVLKWKIGGKTNAYPALRKRRISDADELLFLLLLSSGCIGSKIGLPLLGNFSLLFFRYVIAVLLVGVMSACDLNGNGLNSAVC